MQKNILSKKGASLLEIVATIAITSISLILVYNMLSYNVRLNGINQEKQMSANIASSTINYIKSMDYEEINTYLSNNNEGYYAVINVNTCSDPLFLNESDVCLSVLSPTINNKTYGNHNLNIYLIPYHNALKIDSLKTTPPVVFPDILNTHIQKIDTSTLNTDNFDEENEETYIIRVIVVVKSSINERYDYLLEGVTTYVQQ